MSWSSTLCLIACSVITIATANGESESTVPQTVLVVKSWLVVLSTSVPFSPCSTLTREKSEGSVIAGRLKQTLIGPEYTAVVVMSKAKRSEERRVGKECRSRWWPY